jgi:hypothetical protein
MAAATDSATKLTNGAALPVRLAVICWLMIGAAVSVRTLLEPEKHTIFPILANSSAHWWHDQSLYAEYKPLDYYRYSPTFAIVNTPFWALGARVGGIAWTLLNLGVYAAGLWRFLRDVLPGTWSPGRASLFFILAAVGGLRGFWNAQSNALMIGLLLLAAAAVVREQWWRAALWLALPVLIKVTPVAIVLLFCALWPRRLLGRFILVLAAGLVVPFLTKPPEVVLGYYAEWAQHLTASAGERWPGFRDGWTVWVIARHVVGGEAGDPPLRAGIDAGWYRALQLAAAVVVVGWCLALQRRGCDRRRLISVTVALGAAWLMVFGPASEHATYVFLAPSLAWALVDTETWPRARWLAMAAGLLILGLGWGELERRLNVTLLFAALPIGALIFAIWAVGYSVAAERAMESPASGLLLRNASPQAAR